MIDDMTRSLTRLYESMLAAGQQRPPASSEPGRDSIAGNRAAVVQESADLLCNLTQLWKAAGIEPQSVWDEMECRERS